MDDKKLKVDCNQLKVDYEKLKAHYNQLKVRDFVLKTTTLRKNASPQNRYKVQSAECKVQSEGR